MFLVGLFNARSIFAMAIVSAIPFFFYTLLVGGEGDA